MSSPTDEILLEEPPPAAPPPAPPPDYWKKVRRHRRAQRAYFRKGAVRTTLAILGLLAFGVIAADVWYGLSEDARWLTLGVMLVSGCAMLWRWWWRPASAFGELEAVRDLERGFPKLGQRLRTARDVERAWAYRGDDPLGEALLHDTRTRVAELDIRRLVPWHRLRVPLLACLVVGLGYFAAWNNWPEFQTGVHRLFTPWKGVSYTTVEILHPAATFIDKDAPHLVARISGRPAAEATLFVREEGAAEWKPIKMSRAGDSAHFDTVLAGRKKSLDYYVVAGDGRSPQYHLRCLLTPKIEQVYAELTFQHSGIRSLEFT